VVVTVVVIVTDTSMERICQWALPLNKTRKHPPFFPEEQACSEHQVFAVALPRDLRVLEALRGEHGIEARGANAVSGFGAAGAGRIVAPFEDGDRATMPEQVEHLPDHLFVRYDFMKHKGHQAAIETAFGQGQFVAEVHMHHTHPRRQISRTRDAQHFLAAIKRENSTRFTNGFCQFNSEYARATAEVRDMCAVVQAQPGDYAWWVEAREPFGGLQPLPACAVEGARLLRHIMPFP